MKSKHLIIVSLLLAIVTMGIASASEDVAVNDVQATDDMSESIDEAITNDVIEQNEDLELEPSDFNASITDSIDLDDENNQIVVNYTVPQGANGKVEVYVDYSETPSYSKETTSGQSVNITTTNLNIITPGEYHVKVSYVHNNGDTLNLAEHSLKTYVYTENDFSIWYNNWITSKNDNILPHFSYPVAGTLILSINGTPRYTKQTVGLHERVHAYLSDLNITADGIYIISAKYIIGTTSKEIDLGNDILDVSDVDWDQNEYVSIFLYVDILDGADYFIKIDNNGNYLNGTVSVYIDNDLKSTKAILSSDEKTSFEIGVTDLGIYNNIGLGNHTVKVIYMKDNAEKHEVEKSVEFYAKPIFVKDFLVSVGEKDVLKVTYLKGFTGIATLYNAVKEQSQYDPEYYYWIKGSVYKSANFINGVATIPFDSLAEGEHVFILNISGYDAEKHIYVTSKRNSPEFSASISSSEIIVGNSIVVTFKGLQSSEIAYIYLDDKEFTTLPLTGGQANHTIAGLSTGTHRIKVLFDNGTNFYSNTFYVTVKNATVPAPTPQPAKKKVIKLTLKKVKVKKSAKKLVLKATLKINGKAVKGKKIIFKFKGKTYKAKTNKKGIAKVTIKKKVLKKLKVGKKVKYQAKYGKITKKITVKVRK